MATTEKKHIDKEAEKDHVPKEHEGHSREHNEELHSHVHEHAEHEHAQSEKQDPVGHKHAEAKAPAKPAVKTGKLTAKKDSEAGKKEAKKKKPKEKVALMKVRKSDAVKSLRDKIKEKNRLPVFRGKFGCENIRRHNIEKFGKWRKPRGIDTKRKKENGASPRPGYGSLAETKSIHPSGFKEVLVANPKQLAGVQKENTAVRILGTVGQKKRREIVKQANNLGIHVLNY
ncbi:MAG: eL32 family ribosomal protein [Candidatus Diapherotrites archaeon]|nr:eL32 family ribosomal protein [Candidatus Diapherotrites archaeon]